MNYYSILDGKYELEKVQEFERPFYEHLQRQCDPIEAMGRPMTYEEMNQYWIKLPEGTSSSPSGHQAIMSDYTKQCMYVFLQRRQEKYKES